MELNIFTDGGARGNPGPAGFGVALYDKDKLLASLSGFIGHKTNNEAEYAALVYALKWVVQNQSKYLFAKIIFHTDSQLLCRQMQGIYKLKSPNLKPLKLKADNLLSEIHAKVIFNNILRGKNQEADKLANLAMDTCLPYYEI